MSTSMIKNTSVSFTEIKADVRAYLEGLSNFEEIKDLFPASNLTFIENLIAGFGTYVAGREVMFREETYLSKAKLPSSVYQIANTFGYSINRYTNPVVKFRYNGVPTITLKSGDKVGTYNNMDVVYFGPNLVLEKLDTFLAFVGEYFEDVRQVIYNDNGAFTFDLNPQSLTSISRDCISCSLEGVQQPISRDIEDYIVFSSICDYSIDPFSTRLFVSDEDNTYGVVAPNGAEFKVKYLETNGVDEDLRARDIQPIGEFLALSVEHIGTDGDSLDKIKRLAPLLYSTLRRMVTERDHKYITESHPFVASASAERDLGQPLKVAITISGSYTSDLFTVDIFGTEYSYQAVSGGLKAEAVQGLYDAITQFENSFYTAELDLDNNTIYVTSSDARRVDFFVDAVSHTTVTEVDANVKPACCTVNIYYVSVNTTDNPYIMTVSERNELATFLQAYKMVGVRLVLIPATKNPQNLAIRIKLNDPLLFPKVEAEIKKIARQYELKLDTGFYYGNFLVKVSDLTILNDEGDKIKPVISVVPDQPIFAVEPSKYSYIKFDNVGVVLE